MSGAPWLVNADRRAEPGDRIRIPHGWAPATVGVLLPPLNEERGYYQLIPVDVDGKRIVLAASGCNLGSVRLEP